MLRKLCSWMKKRIKINYKLRNYFMKKFLMMTAALLMTAEMIAATVQTTAHGVTIRPDGGQAKVICLEVINNHIIRVRATSKDVLPEKPASLMIVPQTAPPKGSYSVSEEGETVVVKAKNVTAVVSKATGEVAFFDANDVLGFYCA